MSTIAIQLPAPSTSSEYRLAADVVIVPIEDGSARLLDFGGKVFALDPVAAMMLQAALRDGREAAVGQISEHFGVEPGQVSTDLETLLSQLLKRRLLLRGTSRGPLRWVQSLIATILALLAWPVVRVPGLGLFPRAWSLLLLAKLSCATAGWSATVAMWKKLIVRGGGTLEDAAGRIPAIERAVRRAGACHLVRVECKERALSSWALARDNGIAAVLVVGISPFPFAGHCWCEAGAQMISDDASRITEFSPVVKYA